MFRILVSLLLYCSISYYDIVVGIMIFILILVLVDITYLLHVMYVILEVEILSSGMLKFIFRLIHIYDIIVNHFLISYLVHTCCSLVWYLDT